MRPCPRYSLLTLLVVTALISGGVKLWYGPHRVVEPDGPRQEKVYTYTRDWRGNRIIHGPLVLRRFEDQKPVSFRVMYYRQGTDVNWMYESEFPTLRNPNFTVLELTCPLSAEELLDFHQVRDAELQRLVATGRNTDHPYEGMHYFRHTGGILPRGRIGPPVHRSQALTPPAHD